jgi:hypothetical protein
MSELFCELIKMTICDLTAQLHTYFVLTRAAASLFHLFFFVVVVVAFLWLELRAAPLAR